MCVCVFGVNAIDFFHDFNHKFRSCSNTNREVRKHVLNMQFLKLRNWNKAQLILYCSNNLLNFPFSKSLQQQIKLVYETCNFGSRNKYQTFVVEVSISMSWCIRLKDLLLKILKNLEQTLKFYQQYDIAGSIATKSQLRKIS